LNLELATSVDVLAVACRLRPYQATIVPERREEVTTEGGLDLSRPKPRLRDTIRRLDEVGARVSLFIDPDPVAVDAAKDLGVPAIELHTGRYAHTWRESDAALDELRRAARHAADMGLFVHAGHGLTYRNVVPVAAIPEIEELNIGHSVVSRAVMVGMRAAVEEMLHLVRAARR
jgi:pyridoxine 5-phosphate synthase